MAAGRPNKYKPEYCERVIELGRLGMSVVEMAADIGVGKTTLERWREAHEEFRCALDDARDFAQAWWESQGRVNLIMPKDSGQFQGSVWSRSMAARFPKGWRENKGVELTGKDGADLNLSVTFVEPAPKAE